jgi:hypothetical protein
VSPQRKPKPRSPNPKRRSPKPPKPADQSFARSVSAPTAQTRQVGTPAARVRNTSPLLDTRVIFCGDNLDKLKDFPDALTEIDPSSAAPGRLSWP